MHNYPRWVWLIRALGFLLVAGGIFFYYVQAEANAANSAPPPSNQAAALAPAQTEVLQVTPGVTDQACLLCHENSDAVITFPSGETLPVQVDTAVLAASAHGMAAETALACTSCHAPADYQFPHPPVEIATLREYELARSQSCEQCHTAPHLTSHPVVGMENAVGCTDCHGAHDVHTAEQLQTGAATDRCVACHTEAGVQFVEATQLTAMIQDGLFGSQYETNEYCLACHQQSGLEITFASGETRSATVDPMTFHDSVHGVGSESGELRCIQCHEDYSYPHEPVTAVTAREYSLEKYPVCINCHETKYDAALDDVHGRALAEGNLEAAVCTDCHGAHDTPPPNEPRQRISLTCNQCHDQVFDEYVDSVHGAALFEESNPDVPTCIDCHGVHNIADPTTALFRVRSPRLCAECHADEQLMQQYDISTDVFDTYVADFHGTTVTLFEHQDPTVETNKAVCYDCHGVHDIKRPEDPDAGIRANLLETCQQCHPDATENFPASWTSHFQPSLQNNPLVYLVNLFYQIVIPLTVGGFAFLVSTDIYRRVRQRFLTGKEGE